MIHAYIINLANASERMDHMRSEIERVSIPHTRVEAVYGDHLKQPIKELDEKGFHVRTGKAINLREVGCYLSHIKALRSFLESEHAYALVLEDDVNLPDGLHKLLSRAIEHQQHWDLLRLSSSRTGEFIKIAQIDPEHQLAYNIRVLKNTGAYLINRYGAEQCLQHLLPMNLPYDVALDREWDFQIKTACVTPFPIQLEDFPTQIMHRAKRIRRYRSTTFHLFHLLTRFQRIHHRKNYARAAGVL